MTIIFQGHTTTEANANLDAIVTAAAAEATTRAAADAAEAGTRAAAVAANAASIASNTNALAIDERVLLGYYAALVGARGSAALHFVDSVNGNDANSGLSPRAPKRTIAATMAVAPVTGDALLLARGSTWREQIDIPADNFGIAVYGTGAMPVLDGADVLPAVWTQPNAGLYPNVWSQSFTRAIPPTTSQEFLGYWENGVRPRYASDATADLQANGGWFSSNLIGQTSTISIKSVTNPNVDGIVREASKRQHGINGHTVTNPLSPSRPLVIGPLEIKRCVGHDNALPGGRTGTSRLVFLRDGNVHHTVTEGDLTEDAIGTEFSPQVAPIVFDAYRNDGTGFNHTFRRCLALYPGGVSRPAQGSAFYMHSTTGAARGNILTLDQCATRGQILGDGAAAQLVVQNCYAEDPYYYAITGSATLASITRLMVMDLGTAPGTTNGLFYRGTVTASTFTLTDVCSYTTKFYTVQNGGGAGGTRPVLRTSSIVAGVSSSGMNANGNQFDIRFCVITTVNGGLVLDNLSTLYVGDFNVFAFDANTFVQFRYNSTVYSSLGAFQTASGQDANSVFLKSTDQGNGNAGAFWLGVSSGANAGPSAGDFRINPNAKVYNGAGTLLTGTFADGTTPITQAGAQTHWDFNARAVVAGPPNRYPVLPATIADMRTYLENPASWNFYP